MRNVQIVNVDWSQGRKDMGVETGNPILMFMALFALYSPLAALSSYLPIIGRFSSGDQLRLAIGLFINVAVFVLLAVWVGEPILELLGVTTAALSVTGGIALLYAGIPMMRGQEESVPDDNEQDQANPENEAQEPWRSVLFMPLTFPLTIGGTSFGLIVAFAASAQGLFEDIYLSVAGLAYAVLTGLTVYAAGHLHRRVSVAARAVLSRIAGILLTAIGVTLLIGGATRMIIDTLTSLGRV